jgi:hypothetical protein
MKHTFLTQEHIHAFRSDKLDDGKGNVWCFCFYSGTAWTLLMFLNFLT